MFWGVDLLSVLLLDHNSVPLRVRVRRVPERQREWRNGLSVVSVSAKDRVYVSSMVNANAKIMVGCIFSGECRYLLIPRVYSKW